MFIGHYGVALGAHAIFPAAPLPILMVATQALDIVWAALVLADVEKVEIRPGATDTTPLDLHQMPYSHSLAGATGISLMAALAAFFVGFGSSVAVVVLAVAFSHWLLDLLVHDRTLIVINRDAKAGFGLWHNRPVSIAVEYALIGAGVLLYWGRSGFTGDVPALFWPVAAFLVLVQSVTFFGPPPKTVNSLAATMLVLFAIITTASFWI